MKTCVILLRGINVGGRNKLPMVELVAILEDLGCRNVSTYIQSGNAVLECPARTADDLARRAATAIDQRHGFQPHVLLLELAEFRQAVTANPFPDAASDPRALHLGFLDQAPPAPDLDRLRSLQAHSERFEIVGKVFYLHAPDGIGRSRLAAGAEQALGVPMTSRNWRTVNAILELAETER